MATPIADIPITDIRIVDTLITPGTTMVALHSLPLCSSSITGTTTTDFIMNSMTVAWVWVKVPVQA
jgi:hypothetical protein